MEPQKMELVDRIPDHKYAFTITFKRYLESETPKRQLQLTLPMVHRILSMTTTYALIPELTENNRIHYHGMFTIRDLCKGRHKKLTIPALGQLGYIKIKLIDDWPKWLKYISKDYEENKDIFDVEDLLFTHKNGFIFDDEIRFISLDTFFYEL